MRCAGKNTLMPVSRSRFVQFGIAMASLCLLAPLAAPAQPVQAQAAESLARISLPGHVQVGQSDVRLGDVASLASRDPALLRRLMDLPLGRAPRAGQSFVLERDVLARWIRSHAGLQGDQITWQGAAFTDVSLRSRDISGEDIVATADKALRRQLGGQLPAGTRIELLPVAVPPDLALADESVELIPRPMSTAALAPRMTVWVDVGTAGKVQRSAAVVFEVAVYGPVVVAARDIPAGASLLPGDVQVREQNMANAAISQKSPARGFSDGQRLRRPIRAGETLTAAHTEAIPDVARGSWAVLEARQAGLNVQSRAEVLQDGRAGQMVQVKPVNATTSLLVRVAGPGRVEMYP
jgi:flagellar basal body P-ring formation protein FlgA